MSELSLSAITAVMSSITAIVAIIVPAITSVHSTKMQERLKRMELHTPRVYDAIADMAETYAHLIREYPNDSDWSAVDYMAKEKYYCFSAACYKVMGMIPDDSIHNKITALLSDKRMYMPSDAHDQKFNEIMADITAYLHLSKADLKQRRNSTAGKEK